MDEFIFYNRHYIRTDDRGCVVDGWSDGPVGYKDTAGAICINEKGGYQFRLINGVATEENPSLWDSMSMGMTPLYKWDGSAVVKRTEEEIEADREAIRRAEAEKQAKMDAINARQMALEEAQAMFITTRINTLVVDDTTALRWRMLYPVWSPDSEEYQTGDKVQHMDRLYRCLQGHTSQPGWAPELVASLWTEVNETHAGTADDPIPYNGNMALDRGFYYSQAGVTYRCTRDTDIPVYNALQDLVGLYVEVAEE